MATASRLWALDGPSIVLAAGEIMIGGKGSVRIPTPAFLIEHERGLVLFDTGMAPGVNDDPVAYFGAELTSMLQVETSPERRIDDQLAKLGFRPEDVSHVILSHTHFDHAGGLHLFPHARFLRGPNEFEWAASPHPGTERTFRYASDIAPTEQFDWSELATPVLDYFGDGSLRVYHTPGHSPGQLSLRVALPTRTITLTGDAVHLRAAFEGCAPDPHGWDTDVARESIRTLHEFEAEGDDIWISHEMADWRAFGGALVPVA